MRIARPLPHRALAPLRLGLLLLLLLLPPGCRPELGEATGTSGAAGGGGGAAVEWSLEPSAPPERAPPALRIRLHADPPVDPDRVVFVAGRLGTGHLRQLAAGSPSNALQERFLPATIWREGDEVVVAPHERLEPGTIWLERTWPLPDAEAVTPVAILCGESELPPFALALELGPSGHPATFTRGASSAGAGRRCARLVASAPVTPGTVLLMPPALVLEGAQLALDPTPLVPSGALPADVVPLACEPPEVVVGPGCARVLDDRAVVRGPSSLVLWAASGAELDVLAVTEPGESFALHPLRPAAENPVVVGVIDAAGRETLLDLVLHTAPPMPHPVLNEMLADCVGPEPSCEWIEIVNDGAVDAPLGALRILDVGGEVPLPPITLPPGAFALVVGESYEPDPALDPAPAPGALILRVPRLGKGGLANAGELVRLIDAEDRVLSAIPPIASEEAGRSTSRRHPTLGDARSSFVAAAPTPGAPNGPL